MFFLGMINPQSLMMDVWMLPVLCLGAAAGLFLNHRLSPCGSTAACWS